MEARDALLARIPEAQATAVEALGRFKGMLDTYREEAATFGDFPSLFLGLVGHDGSWEHYDGAIRVVDSSGQIVADGLDGQRYRDFIGEATQHDNYLKFPYYKPLGYPEGIYRVGPLARLNLCDRMPTPMAERERLRIPRSVRHRDVVLPLPLCPADRDPGGRRGHCAGARRPGNPLLRPAPRPRGGEQPGRRRRQRGAAGHPVSPLQGRSERRGWNGSTSSSRRGRTAWR